jgi:hypothetical protein
MIRSTSVSKQLPADQGISQHLETIYVLWDIFCLWYQSFLLFSSNFLCCWFHSLNFPFHFPIFPSISLAILLFPVFAKNCLLSEIQALAINCCKQHTWSMFTRALFLLRCLAEAVYAGLSILTTLFLCPLAWNLALEQSGRWDLSRILWYFIMKVWQA